MAGRRIEGNFNQGWGIAAFITLLAAAGFAVRSVELDAIEAGGGSLRCCVGEIF